VGWLASQQLPSDGKLGLDSSLGFAKDGKSETNDASLFENSWI